MIQEEDLPSLIEIIDKMPVGICIIKDPSSIMVWNLTLEQWTGISRESSLGKDLCYLIPTFETPFIRERIRIAFEGGGPVLFSSRFHPQLFPLRNPGQSEGKFQRTTLIPFELPAGISGALFVVEDVTRITEQVMTYRQIKDQIQVELEERKKAEKALAVANNKLNTLASVTRHDLQNLITAFEGYLLFAMQERPEGMVKTYLDKMSQVTEVMKKQIAFTKDYQDMGINTPTWIQIECLIHSSVAGPHFGQITLDLDIGALEIFADPLITKAIYNLLENSVRHGGDVTRISVSSKQHGGELHLIIEDNGKGVSEAIKKRIFERGFGSNTGLGLFLTREILGITGIQVIEDGKEGEGARFDLLIPDGQFRWIDTKVHSEISETA